MLRTVHASYQFIHKVPCKMVPLYRKDRHTHPPPPQVWEYMVMGREKELQCPLDSDWKGVTMPYAWESEGRGRFNGSNRAYRHKRWKGSL
jgi:hypothetical protein